MKGGNVIRSTSNHSLLYYTAMQPTEYKARIEGQFVFPIFGQTIYHIL